MVFCLAQKSPYFLVALKYFSETKNNISSTKNNFSGTICMSTLFVQALPVGVSEETQLDTIYSADYYEVISLARSYSPMEPLANNKHSECCSGANLGV